MKYTCTTQLAKLSFNQSIVLAADDVQLYIIINKNLTRCVVADFDAVFCCTAVCVECT